MKNFQCKNRHKIYRRFLYLRFLIKGHTSPLNINNILESLALLLCGENLYLKISLNKWKTSVPLRGRYVHAREIRANLDSLSGDFSLSLNFVYSAGDCRKYPSISSDFGLCHFRVYSNKNKCCHPLPLFLTGKVPPNEITENSFMNCLSQHDSTTLSIAATSTVFGEQQKM